MTAIADMSQVNRQISADACLVQEFEIASYFNAQA